MSAFHDQNNIYPHDVVLRVTDLQRSLEFYQKIMGLKVLSEMDGGHVLSANGVTPLVTITSGEDIQPKTPRRTGLYHFAILLPDRISLGLFLKNLNENQYPISGGAYHGVSEAIYLQDPDDNGIEIYADTQEESWERADETISMVTERLDYDALMALTEDRSWEGAPEDTILGHMHLHVADLDTSLAFYETIGFRVTQRLRQQAYFVSTGGYHHHIGFNIWNGRNAEPLPENNAGMAFFTLKFPSAEIMKKSIDSLKDKGYEVTEEAGSIYARDPSGNRIRFIL